MITQQFYISTGRKNAMYTLRYRRFTDDPSLDVYMPDNYMRTLAATADKAIEKARAFFEAWCDRVGNTNPDFRLELNDSPDNDTYERRGKLSVADTFNIEKIEAGTFPFGKHAGKAVADAPESYVLFFADMLTKPDADQRPVSQALYAACLGVALERGYIAKRDVARAERADADAKSVHIGTIGERRNFTGTVVTQFFKSYGYVQDGGEAGFWINKVRVGDDLVTYVGKKLGERDAVITFKATIKKHDEYKGVKSTVVNRPKLAD